MDQGTVCCCMIFVVIPLLVTFIVLMSLGLRTYNPTCTLKDLYIPALNTRLPIFNSSSTSTAAFIFFDVELDGVKEKDGVRYKYINPTLAFYYGRKSGIWIANYTVPGFSQGSEESTHLQDVVETVGMPWRDAFAAVSGGSAAAFTVELATRVKVKREVGHSGVRELLLRADVDVNGSGETVQKKAIKLKKP